MRALAAAALLAAALLAAPPLAARAAAQVPPDSAAADSTAADTAAAPAAPAPSTMARRGADPLGLDRLGLVAFGAAAGIAAPSSMEPTTVFALSADYGELAPRWRLVFGASYWSTRFTADAVQRLADSLGAVVVDPTGDARVEIGGARYLLLSLTADVRRTAEVGNRVFPYVGAGIGVHASNIEAPGVSGTLLENAFDTIVAGIGGSTGVTILLLPNLALSMDARLDLLSGLSVGALTGGARYIFGTRRRG